MFARSVTATIAAITLTLPAALLACGDKFLVPGRGVRFKAKVNREAAAILLYASPGTAPEQALRTLAVEGRLRAAGYRPTLITTPEDLEAVLASGRWDVLVIDLDRASDLKARFPAASAPVVLPVAHDVSKAVVEEAKRLYSHVIDLSRKHGAWLDAIDEAIAARARARRKAAAHTGA